GLAEQVSGYLADHYADGLDLVRALHVAVAALGHDDVQPRTLTVDRLEVALLDRTRTQPRKFRRIAGERLEALFEQAMPTASQPDPDAPADDAAAPAGGTAGADEGTPAAAVEDDVLGDLPDDPDDAQQG
ncbi:MAG: proteasome alpha subunit, partial [Nocardioidaceae bacterium]|nr:proteasome alpha subunit [Nocardioidaceae bacterium]